LTYEDTPEGCPKSTAQYGLCAGPIQGSLDFLLSQKAPTLRSVPRSRLLQPAFRHFEARTPRCSNRKELLSQLFPALHGLQRHRASLRCGLSPSNRMGSGLFTYGPSAFAFNTADSSCCLDFQRSPLHRSRIAESTPGFRIAAETFASWLLHLLDVPTARFHAASPVFSSSILSALLQRLTILGFIIVSRIARAHSIPVMLVCPSKLSLRLQLSRQMSESTLLPACFSAFVRGGLLLLPGRHPALLLLRSFGTPVAGRSVCRFQP